jgi:GTP cyclohydrolase IA
MSQNKKNQSITSELATACDTVIRTIGEDPKREGLIKTPERFGKAMADLTVGYSQDLNTLINGALFEQPNKEMVVVKGIEFYSLCEHHILPFFGHVHVGYIPNGKVVGLSKIPRIVNMFARRLQIQERLTGEIADALQEILNPVGVAVVIESQHMCMMMRGIQVQGGRMVTNAMRGEFLNNSSTRSEFMTIVSTALSSR